MVSKTIVATLTALLLSHTSAVQAAEKMTESKALMVQTQQTLQQQLKTEIRHSAQLALAESFATSEVASHQQPSQEMQARMAPQLPEAALLPMTECNG
ncbi:hypothetical protein EZV61_11820 [Corallincola luteus]|uniref:Uncharacterized protein n=1 Tax=Corallincola luteus TaxID=1775177 RepID=A0ABY2AKI2_9GAMM|nr:hypothetical protein [Corallincola luteus]TCI02968.1 hypothetical protein EZV61_11820 [Corallincola luteus]